MLYTIGYQNLDPRHIKEAAERFNIARIIDVRSTPYSKRPEFNRPALEEYLGALYEWRGDVLGGKGWGIQYEALAALDKEARKQNVMLMCLERHPCHCHRYHLICKTLLPMGIDAWHLVGTDIFKTSVLDEICERLVLDKTLNLFEQAG